MLPVYCSSFSFKVISSAYEEVTLISSILTVTLFGLLKSKDILEKFLKSTPLFIMYLSFN